MAEEKSIIVKTKEGVVEAIQGTGDVTNALLGLVSGALVTALKGTKMVGAEAASLIKDTIVGSVRGIAEVGGRSKFSCQRRDSGGGDRNKRSYRKYPGHDRKECQHLNTHNFGGGWRSC